MTQLLWRFAWWEACSSTCLRRNSERLFTPASNFDIVDAQQPSLLNSNSMQAALLQMAHADTRIVSITVTEKG